MKREIRSADSLQIGRWYDFALPPHGRGVLVVCGDARKHQQIAQLLTELRASSGQPAGDLAKQRSLKTYSFADLPIWSKDGKMQSVDLLLSYLRSNVDPHAFGYFLARRQSPCESGR